MKLFLFLLLVHTNIFAAVGSSDDPVKTGAERQDERKTGRKEKRNGKAEEQKPIEAEDFDNTTTFVDTENLPTDNSMVSNYFYVGAWMGVMRSPPSMEAISPTFYLSPYWGSDWNEDFSFEGSIYNYKFYEDLYKRPNHTGDPKLIYQETGIKLRYLEFLSDKKYMRLRPLFEVDSVLLPYFGVGLQIEPNILIQDPKLELIKYYDTSHWGAGINLAFGWLHVLKNTSFRLRYELGMDNNYNPMHNSEYFKRLWTEFYFTLGMEWSFSLKGDYEPVKAEVYSSFNAYDTDQFDKEKQAEKASGEDDLSEISKDYELGSKAISKQNLLKKNNYSIIFEPNSQDLNRNMINKIQKITYQYRNDSSYKRTYKIYAVAPKNKSDSALALLDIARKRAVLVNDFMVSGEVPQESIVYSWKVIEPSPSSALYGSNDYVIIEEYIAESMPPVSINKSNQTAQAEALIIAEREARLRKPPQNPNDSTIVENKTYSALVVENIDTNKKTGDELDTKPSTNTSFSKWVMPADNLKGGSGGDLSSGSKVKSETYKDSSTYANKMKPNETETIKNIDNYGKQTDKPATVDNDVSSGIYYKMSNTPPTKEIKSELKYSGEKSFVIKVNPKDGIFDEETATLATETFMMLESDGYKMNIEYWFNNNQNAKLEDNVFLFSEVSTYIEAVIKKGASESNIIVAKNQNPSLKDYSDNGKVYLVRILITK